MSFVSILGLHFSSRGCLMVCTLRCELERLDSLHFECYDGVEFEAIGEGGSKHGGQTRIVLKVAHTSPTFQCLTDTACLAQKMKLNCNQAIKMDSINPAGVVNIPERVWW
ncbi:hypothetical protein M758_1G293900 [Ceratodon purpureus]|nr:hypothetical protein M758_1G293900 [Ceratodon purpureus]